MNSEKLQKNYPFNHSCVTVSDILKKYFNKEDKNSQQSDHKSRLIFNLQCIFSILTEDTKIRCVHALNILLTLQCNGKLR